MSRNKILIWKNIYLFITKKIAWKRLRKNENIYAKNKVQKKRKIAAFITKKIENNCSQKTIVLKKKYNRVGLELLTQSFEDRQARLAPYTKKKFLEELPKNCDYS